MKAKQFAWVGLALVLVCTLLPFVFQQHSPPSLPPRQEQEQEQQQPPSRQKMAEDDSSSSSIIGEASQFDQTLQHYFEDKADSEVALVYLYGNIQPATGKSVLFFFFFNFLVSSHLFF